MYQFIAVDFSKHWTKTYLQHDIRSTGALGTIWIVFPVTKASWKDLSDKFGEEKHIVAISPSDKEKKKNFLTKNL